MTPYDQLTLNELLTLLHKEHVEVSFKKWPGKRTWTLKAVHGSWSDYLTAGIIDNDVRSTVLSLVKQAHEKGWVK